MASAMSSAVETQGANVATLSTLTNVSQAPQAVQSPIVSVNLPNNFSSVPMTMQMPGVSGVPIAVCALNSQQPTVAATQTMQPAAAVQQPNAGGNIIVLNVGGGNNLAAAISQLVAGGLIPQQQVAQVAAQSPTVTNTVQVPASTVAQQQNCSSPNQIYGGTSQNLTYTQIPSAAMSIPSVALSSAHVGHQPATPAQTTTSIPVAASMQIPVQQPQQQAPAAFMLVPIQQLPAVQGGQVSTPQGYINVNQQPQQQQQVFVNVQNQVAGSCGSHSPLPSHVVQGVQQSQAQQILQAVTPNNTQPSSVPKNDELKAYLTQSGRQHLTTLHSTNSPHVMAALAPAQLQHTLPISSGAMSQLLLTPQTATQTFYHTPHPTPARSAPPPPRVSTPQSTRPQFQTTVSSPGLAFLAQVSTLSASHSQTLVSTLEPSATTLTTAMSASGTNSTPTLVSGITAQSTVSTEVNNNLEPRPPECSKASDSVLGATLLTRACATPSSSMMVSSTTKIGDDSIPEIIEGSSTLGQPAEMIVTEIHELAEDNQFSFQTSVSATSSPSEKKGLKEKRKKGPAPKLNGTEVCLICGDKASGFHYNILSCEGCKGFFRRSVIKGARYQCKMNGDCQMDLFMRRKCQKCRFQKCKLVGMKEESVLSEEQVKAKKMKKECDSPFSPMRSLSEDSSVPTLTPQQRNLVELLKANEKRFEWPTTEDMKKVTAWVEEDDSIHSKALRFAHFTELCILIVQLVVEFTKQLPGFLTVLREDQIVLLKACAIEVMLLRAAKQYNKHDGTINFLNGKLYDKSSFYRAGMQVEFVDPIFQFCKSMARLDLDETEYAILVAINTFSTDRPHIKDFEKVECMQDPYVELLRVYSRIRHPNDPLMFARILMKIVELRTLNNYHSEQIFALKVQDRKLPPLLAEIWDM